MKISPEILEGLSRAPKTEKKFEDLIFQAAIELGFCLNRPYETSDQSTYVEVWENTLNYLDSSHPGWRGYSILLPNGERI
jgi:hypothetical protein